MPRIIASKAFKTSEVHRNLLNYLAEKSLAGEAHTLKEYTVGLDVFGIGGVVVSADDLTTQRQAEVALAASQATLQAALDSTTEAVFITDAQGRFLTINRAAAEFFEFTSPADFPRTFADFDNLIEVWTPDGTQVTVETSPLARALRGEKVIETGWKFSRIQPRTENIYASVYSALGIDWRTEMTNTPSKRAYRYVDVLGATEIVSDDEIAELFV